MTRRSGGPARFIPTHNRGGEADHLSGSLPQRAPRRERHHRRSLTAMPAPPSLLSLPLLAQAPPRIANWLLWLVVWGDPAVTDHRWFGGMITWAKVVGL